jgi:hypothetical protein
MELMERDFAPRIWYELNLLDLHHEHGTINICDLRHEHGTLILIYQTCIYQTYILHSSNFLFLFTYPFLKTKTQGEAVGVDRKGFCTTNMVHLFITRNHSNIHPTTRQNLYVDISL